MRKTKPNGVVLIEHRDEIDEYWFSFCQHKDGDVARFGLHNMNSFSLDDYGLLHSYNDLPSGEINKSKNKNTGFGYWWHHHGTSHRINGPAIHIHYKTMWKPVCEYYVMGINVKVFDLIQQFIIMAINKGFIYDE